MRSAFLPLAICAAALLAWPVRADDADSNGKKPEHKITQSKSFVMVEPFYTAIYDAGRPIGMLMVAIGLDIPDSDLRNQAETGMPLLRDYYLRNLLSFSATAVRPWQQPDVNEIGARLQRVTDRALHRPGAKVLLAQVAIRVSR
jgi:flagellar basal body-associated protein FliL